MTTTSCANPSAQDYMSSHWFRNARLPSGALCMEHRVIQMRTTYAWLSQHALKPWADIVGRWWQCLKRTTCEHQMNKTLLVSWHKQLDDFLGCLEALISCIGVGRTARLLCKVCTKDILESAVSYLKRWQIRTSRFGMLSSE
jgi:hypothetical protein